MPSKSKSPEYPMTLATTLLFSSRLRLSTSLSVCCLVASRPTAPSVTWGGECAGVGFSFLRVPSLPRVSCFSVRSLRVAYGYLTRTRRLLVAGRVGGRNTSVTA